MEPILYLSFYFGLLLCCAPWIGYYMSWVLESAKLPMESFFYRLLGIQANASQTGKKYFTSLIVFHIFGTILLFSILFFQEHLFLNPANISGFSWDLAWNTTVSFITNTNWQAYSGESQLSYFSQMIGLSVQNFLSAGVGISVLAAVARGLSNSKESNIGNFWKDLFRSTFYILLPFSIILALVLVAEGVVQTFSGPISLTGFDGQKITIPLGPAASQISIKQLGTNGGGFFGLNSAHPFENPTPISNFWQTFALLFLPASCVFFYGKLVGSFRHAWVVLFVMLFVLIAGFGIAYSFENNSNFVWEGKETRFNLTESTLWLSATTAASNGSVNSMHDSYSPIAGGVALFNIMLGEIIFGGVGTGMYSMVLFILLTVFLSGLMTGRTPEYLGKKIESYDMKWTIMGILVPSLCIIVGTSITLLIESGQASIFARGPHGLTQVLYAYSSASGNNGSAFGGFGANTVWANVTLSICMLIGRFFVIASALFVASNLGNKLKAEWNEGSFRTDSWLFGILLFSVIIIVGGLSFFPVLALGPILEQILLSLGKTF